MRSTEATSIATTSFPVRAKMRCGGTRDSEINDLGIKITLLNIHPETNEFSLGLNTRQKDWVIIKAMEKPYINILWVGTGILMIGFSIAMVRRFKEMGGISMQ